MKSFTDPLTAPPAGRPNQCLVAPPHMIETAREADIAAPVFDCPADRLAAALEAWLDRQPRTKITARSEDGLQFEVECRTALMRFLDRVSVRIIPDGAERSTIAMLSRSTLGYSDLGVNRKRMEGWIRALADDPKP